VLAALLNAALGHLDGWAGILGRAIVTQTWKQEFCTFGPVLRLPLGPVASITSVAYFDCENVPRTLADTAYVLRSDFRGAFVDLKPGQSWPGAYQRPDAISVTYVCGTAPQDVPAALKVAIMLLVSHWNENREAVVTGTIATELPLSVRTLLEPYRLVGV